MQRTNSSLPVPRASARWKRRLASCASSAEPARRSSSIAACISSRWSCERRCAASAAMPGSRTARTSMRCSMPPICVSAAENP